MHQNTFKSWILGSLLLIGAQAKADDATPNAPTNAPPATSPVTATESAYVSAPEATSTTASMLPEPTFRSETQRRVSPNGPLLATGATVFAASYLPAVIGGALSDRGDKDLYIPVAGPWLTLTSGPNETKTEKTLLIVDGVAQGVGALMMVSSLFIPKKTTRNWYLIGMAPTHVGTGYGMGAAGRF